jgi:hypothetical protein
MLGYKVYTGQHVYNWVYWYTHMNVYVFWQNVHGWVQRNHQKTTRFIIGVQTDKEIQIFQTPLPQDIYNVHKLENL